MVVSEHFLSEEFWCLFCAPFFCMHVLPYGILMGINEICVSHRGTPSGR